MRRKHRCVNEFNDGELFHGQDLLLWQLEKHEGNKYRTTKALRVSKPI